MNPQDKQAIESVFTRIADVERTGAPRDSDAEAFIESRLHSQPGSAYYLAQTVLVQQQALEEAQRKIAALEQTGAPAAQASKGGFGMFGRNTASASQPRNNVQAPARPAPLASSGFGRSAAGGGAGGFLAGAAQTAMGVAGGMMLGSLLGGMFGGNDAQAAAAPEAAGEPAPEEAMPEEDPGMEGGDDFSMGEDF